MTEQHTKQERLNKYLADCGICSRREADRMIEAGRVTVNGRPADMGLRIGPADEGSAGRTGSWSGRIKKWFSPFTSPWA